MVIGDWSKRFNDAYFIRIGRCQMAFVSREFTQVELDECKCLENLQFYRLIDLLLNRTTDFRGHSRQGLLSLNEMFAE